MTTTLRPRGGRRRAWRTAAALGLTLAGVAATSPAAAQAGTYPMYACDVPGINLPAPTRAAWGFYDTSQQVRKLEDCTTRPGRGGSSYFLINYPIGVLAQNTGVGLRLSIPSSGPEANISIARVTDWSETALTPQAAGQAPAIGLNLADAISIPPGGSLSGFDGFGTSGPGHDSGALPPGTKERSLGVFCAYYGGGYGNCTLPSPFLRIRGIRTLLSESVEPSATIQGGILAATPPVKGVEKLSYSASDQESGVEKVEVLLDDTLVATESFARDLSKPVAEQTGACTYTALRACPAARTGLLDIDTRKVPDGAYELVLRVTDAAGNRTTRVGSHAVVVDNVPDGAPPMHPGPVPTGSVGPAGPTGAPGTPGVTGAAGAAGATVQVNGVNGSRGASLRATFTQTRRDTIRSRYGRQVLITGRLVAPDGKPITGARVAVLQQDKMVGARMLPVSEVVTDRAGTFRYVTTAIRSRTIRFGYRAVLADTAFAATKDVGLGVIARLGLSPSRKALRNGQSVVFRGSVASAPANARKVIELQVRKGSQWMTFRSTRLRKGRFSERYRFTRTRGRVTYQFRARMRQEAGFPFLTSHSKTVKVTVRG
jgi:hypothetical protein